MVREPLSLEVRLARENDYQQIIEILNAAIAERRYTALLKPASIVGRAEWFRAHQDGIHPIYVAEDQKTGRVVGWMAVNAYRSGREAFARSCDRAEWFRAHQDGIHPIYVAEDQKTGRVVGWMAVNAYRSGREAFARSCEISYYIAPAFRGHGVGTILMERVIEESRKRGLKNLMAVIFADNQGSLRLAKKHGFEIWGKFPEIVEIDGRETDCYQMGLRL